MTEGTPKEGTQPEQKVTVQGTEYSVVLTDNGEGGLTATSPDCVEAVSDGSDTTEAVSNIADAIEELLADDDANKLGQ